MPDTHEIIQMLGGFFSRVLENFVAVVKISSLPEIFIADLLRGRREWDVWSTTPLRGAAHKSDESDVIPKYRCISHTQ